jgi:hypothetical protein
MRRVNSYDGVVSKVTSCFPPEEGPSAIGYGAGFRCVLGVNRYVGIDQDHAACQAPAGEVVVGEKAWVRLARWVPAVMLVERLAF